MGRGRCVVVIAAIWFAQAATASGDTLCVPSNAIPGCPTSTGLSEPTISDATTNGHNGDTILIAAGTYAESPTDMGKSFTFIGAGPTKTIIKAQGSPGMSISAGSRVLNLRVAVYPISGNTGLQLAGTATDVAVAAQPGVTYAIGVDLLGGKFRHGSVSLPINVSEPVGYGGVVGGGTVSDSTITAAVGAGADSGAKTPSVIRDHIRANQGVLVGVVSPPVIDDSLIRTVGGPSPELGVALSPTSAEGNFAIRHSTVVGSGTTNSTGVHADAAAAALPASSSVLIESSIVRGYDTSIYASAEPMFSFTATTTVTVRHTFYDPAISHTTTFATINKDSHSGNLTPLFVNQAAGNFQLQAGSPAIDAGSSTLGSGESTTDLAGHARRIVGRKGDAHTSDVGAYEFRPHAPRVHVTASKLRVTVGQPVRFHATGSDASPGDRVSFRWSFGPAGPTVTHAFSKAGKHTVTAKATDLDRFTATRSITVMVLAKHH